MTRDEAMAEAKRRWGDDGFATRGAGMIYFYVGVLGEVHGCGLDFESAFADADKRAREGK